MRITKVCIDNYRTFENTQITMSKGENYFVGKNNVGKSSILEMFDILFNNHHFFENDFFDINKPIKIQIQYYVYKEEIGIFDDLISSDGQTLKLNFIQESPDDTIQIIHEETGTPISNSRLKRINYVIYSSNRRSLNENDLTNNSNKYRLIPKLIEHYVNQNDPGTIKNNQYGNDLIKFVNENLRKIGSFQENKLSMKFADNYSDFFTRTMILTSPSGTPFNKLGFGTQFYSIIPLVIIDKIYQILRFSSEDKIIEYQDGTRGINLFLGMDEPEVHLHPNMQLKLMRYITSIMSGSNNDFNSILKILFNLDVIHGQLFVVTHSPDILSNNYQKVERFIQDRNQKTRIISGSTLTFDNSTKKQLLSRISHFKHSLFSDSVLLCEGETEQDALPIFANKMKVDLIDHNVDIVVTNGIENVPPLYNLFTRMGIKCVSIIDNDNGTHQDIYDKLKNVFITKQKDFEHECYASMSLANITHYLHDFSEQINLNKGLADYWFKYLTSDEKESYINHDKSIDELNSIIQKMPDPRKKSIKEKSRKNIISTMQQKSILNGQLIASSVSKVPNSYKNAIEEVIQNE